MNTSKQINAMIVLISTLLVIVGFYTIWDTFRQTDEEERTKDLIAQRAAHLYVQNCRVCHGNSGEGRIGPALNPEVNDNKFTDEARRDEIKLFLTYTLKCGRVGTRMPAWGADQGGSLNDEQIRQLVILISENPSGEGWKHVEELAKEEEAKNPPITLTPLQEVPLVINGATSNVCGQNLAATQAPTVPPTPGDPARTADLVTTDNKFDKNGITIPAGQQVTINLTNNGKALHNFHVLKAADSSGREPKSVDLTAGAKSAFTFTVTAPGQYDFVCDYHLNEMKGVLFVR